MRSTRWTKTLVIPGLICAIGASRVGADTSVKWYDTITMSGYLQTSYTGNFEAAPNNKTNQGRQFDTNTNSFNFNKFLLQIAKPVGESDHYGFTVRLRTGQDAQSLSSSGGDLWVQEAYATYAATSKLSVIGGKFVTPEGYEVVDTVANPNFSLGLLFFAAEPITHTGLKTTYAVNDKVSAMVGVVNGWDALPGNQGAPDVNDNKTIIWQIATTPTKQIGWTFQGTYGNELATPNADPAGDHSKRLSLDTVATVAAMDKLSLAIQGNWGQQTNDPGMYLNDGSGTNTAAGTTHWSGLGLWATFAMTAKDSTSARFEVLNDQNFANRFGAGTFNNTTRTTNQTVKEFTITQKRMLTSAMGVRAEYRHDWSNEAYFVRSDGTSVRDQNTVSADWFVTF